MPATPMSVAEYARKTYMTMNQRQELQESIARNKAALTGHQLNGQILPSVPGIPPHDAQMIRENIAREEAMLNAGTPPPLTPLESRQRLRWMKDLEHKITSGMPSYEQMERPYPVNIDTHIAWERHYLPEILAWKAVRRELDPGNEDPNFCNVELLRSTQPPSVDLRQYWQNHDLIEWEKDASEALPDLDEASFLAFCRLKAADWSAKNIQRELGWDAKIYQKAMNQLRQYMAQDAEDADASSASRPDEAEPSDESSPAPSSESAPSELPWKFTIEDLYAYLEVNDITKVAVENWCGFARNTLANMRRGTRRINPEDRIKILQAVEALVYGRDVGPSEPSERPVIEGTTQETHERESEEGMAHIPDHEHN